MDRIPGVTVSLGGESYEVPPLSFAAVKRFSQDGTFEKVDTVGKVTPGVSDLEKLAAVVRVVHAALVRNYPEITPDRVEEMLDQNSAGAAVLAVRGVTFKPREVTPGEP